MRNTNIGFKNAPEGGEVIIYSGGRNVRLEVRLSKDTVWLDAHKIAVVFGVGRPAIVKHIENIYRTGELVRHSTCSILEQVAEDGKLRKMNLYNLDVIISVGYRVNSKQATQFRVWATGILKKHLVEGYTVNHKLLQAHKQKLDALQKALKLIQHARSEKKLDYKEADGLLDVIENYSYALGLLDDYDRKKLKVSHTSAGGRFHLTYGKVIKAVAEMRLKSVSEIFGREKDQSLKSSVATIYQTFDGKELYPSIEEKAGNLLYFIVKNHSFIDGNKRIAAAIFLWFLGKNSILYKADGAKRLADNALVALTLLIAESHPEEKDTITTLVVNLINKCN